MGQRSRSPRASQLLCSGVFKPELPHSGVIRKESTVSNPGLSSIVGNKDYGALTSSAHLYQLQLSTVNVAR